MRGRQRWRPAATILAVVLAAVAGASLGACAGPGPSRQPRTAVDSDGVVDGWQRLDRSVVPRRYQIDLRVDPRTPRFSGEVSIDVELARATRVIRLHAEALEILEARVVQGGQPHPAEARPGRNGGLSLQTAEDLPPGPARIEIAYAGRFPEHGHGLYRVEDSGRWYAFTQFQPLSARRAFPGFDQPEFKTPFEVKLRVPREMTAVSSGPMVSRVTLEDERLFVFDATRPIPTYLLAFAVGEFDVVPVPGDDRPGPVLRVLTPAGRGALAAYAAGRTPEILAWLVDWFGRPLPFAKMDQLAVPEFTFGAMENVGLVTYRESRLLLDPVHATLADRLWTDVTLAHEISHMWFGNLVTLPWWDDLWLNESFASWMQTKAIDAVAPELEAGLQVAAHTQYVMHLDSKRDARAVRQPVRTAGDVYNAFDGITYGKGAAVLRMVEAWIGEGVFQTAVRAYLDEHAYGSGGTAGLLAELDRASGQPVSRVVVGFIDRPGTPLVSAELVCDEGGLWPATLRLSQRRYLPAGRRDDSEPWSFPLCVRWASGGGNGRGASEESSTCFVVEGASQELRLPTPHCPSWVHPNADERGYYRWSLPEAQLLALTREHLGSLSIRERLALPGGLRALLEAGEIAVEGYLDGLLALSADPHRRMAEAIVPGLSGLARAVRDDDQASFARYVRSVLSPYLERIGLVPREGESRDATLLRSRLVPTLADEGRDPGIRERARRVADAFLDGDASAYTAEEIRVFLPMASWEAGAPHWERLLAAFQASDSPTLRRNLVTALGSFEDPTLVRRSLTLLLDETLRAGEWRVLASAIRREARPEAWAFVQEHHEALVARLGPVVAAQLPGIANGFCTRAERDAVERFFRSQPPLTGRRHNLDLTLEDVERCAEARETIAGPLGSWLAALPD